MTQPTWQTAGALLREASRRLAGPAVEALREAQVLLGFVLSVSRAWLSGHHDDFVDPAKADEYLALVDRRRAGVPVAYLVGTREFFGIDFAVSPDVLIPRPETELLVDTALQILPERGAARVLDLGTGSGCIAVAIATRRPQAQVTAVDRSPAALAVASGNAKRAGADVEFVQSDWFDAIGGRRFDLIVANPPYVAAGDPHLEQGDLRFEPRGALSAGADGLSDLRYIIAGAPAHLGDGGWLLLEHGYDQADACRNLLLSAGFSGLQAGVDLAGQPRLAGGQLLTLNSPNR